MIKKPGNFLRYCSRKSCDKTISRIYFYRLMFVLLLFFAKTSFCFAASGKKIDRNLPMFLQDFYTHRPLYQENSSFDPFQMAFSKVKNHLIDKDDWDMNVITRASEGEIIHFLQWWETKYFLVDADLEAIYTMNQILEQKYPGKYWRGLEKTIQNRFRIQWFKEHSWILMEEYKLFLAMTGGKTTLIHRR